MSHCSISEEVYHQLDLLNGSIKEAIISLNYKWINDIGHNPKSLLDRYLMRKSNDKPGLLESNMDTDILTLCCEAKHWQSLGFSIPVYVSMVYDKWDTLLFVSESVLKLVLAYNRIIESFSHEEKSLFKQLLKILDYKVKPGLSKLTWNSEFIDTYINLCCNHVAGLQVFLDTYKKSNVEILKLCEEICNIPIARLKPNYGYDLYELQGELVGIRDSIFKIIDEKYRTLIQYILVVFEGFQSVIEQSSNEWRNYLANLDHLFEEACKQCLKNALTVMFHAIHGDESTGPSPLLVINIDLIDNKINFLPALSEIARIGGSVPSNFMEPLKLIRRIVERFGYDRFITKGLWETFQEDEGFILMQRKLDNEVVQCFIQVKAYLTTWEPFRDMWEVNKDMFIKRYEKLKPTVASFDADIGRYTEVANNVLMQETVTSVHFLDINSDRLKLAIIGHCSQWQEKLTALLLQMTMSLVDELYKYMAENQIKMSKKPKDLATLQTTLDMYERLCAEIPGQEENFPRIREQYQTLEKYEVPMTVEFKRRVKNLDHAWANYLGFVAKSKNMIDTSKV